ncbi:MAG TPA: hypothetical protein VGK16_11465 [Candidatus Limnocylindrales bacterium]
MHDGGALDRDTREALTLYRLAGLGATAALLLSGCGLTLPDASQGMICEPGLDDGQCVDAVQRVLATAPDAGASRLIVVVSGQPNGGATFGGQSIYVVVEPWVGPTSGGAFGFVPPTWLVTHGPRGDGVQAWSTADGALPDHVIAAVEDAGIAVHR